MKVFQKHSSADTQKMNSSYFSFLFILQVVKKSIFMNLNMSKCVIVKLSTRCIHCFSLIVSFAFVSTLRRLSGSGCSDENDRAMLSDAARAHRCV